MHGTKIRFCGRPVSDKHAVSPQNPGTILAQYRCYFLDADHHVFEVDMAEHPTDRHAIKWGHALAQTHAKCIAIELWSGARLVSREPCASAAD